jgi:gliding motility-associated-like protein
LYLIDTTNPCLSDPDGAVKTGIDIKNSKNIIFGARNKGNVTNGYKYEAISLTNDQNIYMADNIFGLNPLSASLDPICSGGISLVDVLNVTIGDENAGNTFFSGIGIGVPFAAAINTINIKYNNFGVGPDGVSTWHSGSGTYLSIAANVPTPTEPQPQNLRITISENLISHYGESFGGMAFSRFGGSLTIKHNWFGTDRSATLPLNLRKAHPGDGIALYLEELTADVTIGDADPALGNKFAYSYVGVISNNTKNVKLIRNSFKCIDNKEYINSVTLPQIEVTATTGEYISGTADANAVVDVFSSDDCVNCSPETYIGTTTADAAGKWKYTFVSPPTGSIIGNSHVGKQSSNFSKPEINVSKIQVTGFDCGQSGKVTGITVKNTDALKWVDEKGVTVSTELELKNAQPGRYKLIIGKFCTVESNYITVEDLRPQIFDGFMTTTNPACNEATGSIKNLFAYAANQQLTYKWYDQNNKIVGNSTNIEGLPAGQYTFSAKTASGCETTYGPVKLINTAAPVIVENSYTTTPSDCNSPTGAINGIYGTGGTGTLKYSWRNNQDQEVSTSPNPTGQYAGKYRLRVTDESNCSPVYSSEIEILESNGVSLDRTGQGGRSATCNQANGSITGLQASGATTYKWVITGTSTTISDKPDLKDVQAGLYTLTISNTTCSRSYDFEVAGFLPTVFTGITYTKTKTCDAFPTGTITLNTENTNEQPTKYRWVNSAGENVGFDKTVQFLPAGNYTVYLTDKNFCENQLTGTFTVEAYPEFKVSSFGTVTNTQCGVGIGGVSATNVTGGTGNYIYQWLNADDNDSPIAGKDRSSIENVLKGHYKLRITDGGCNLAEIPYTITDEAATPPTPSADNVRVYNAGKAIIKINNPFPTAIYRLYETATSPLPIKDTIGGNISVNVTESLSYYVSLTYGYCESDRTEVKVFLSALTGDIVNTFTPNGDGINDYWVIKGLDTYPDATVKIFNRYGSSVFESVGYAKPFDGNRNGKPLPAGVYYYIINLKRGGLLSGSVTIIR